MGVHIDFDIPTYLRAGHGLAVVSSRLDHMLPECSPEPQVHAPSEKVVINRVFNPMRLTQPQPTQPAPVPTEPSPPAKIKEETSPEDQADTSPSDQENENEHHDATELSFRGQQGKPVVGVYLGCGNAPYRFNKGNSRSFFIRIDEHLIWGVELKTALKRSDAQKGDRIEVTFKGKVPIKVLKDVKQGDRTDQVWETRHRNQWDVRVLSD